MHWRFRPLLHGSCAYYYHRISCPRKIIIQRSRCCLMCRIVLSRSWVTGSRGIYIHTVKSTTWKANILTSNEPRREIGRSCLSMRLMCLLTSCALNDLQSQHTTNTKYCVKMLLLRQRPLKFTKLLLNSFLHVLIRDTMLLSRSCNLWRRNDFTSVCNLRFCKQCLLKTSVLQDQEAVGDAYIKFECFLIE